MAAKTPDFRKSTAAMFLSMKDSPIKTMPSKNLVEVLKILQQINNSMNLLSIKASSLNLIDATAYWENVESLKNTIRKLLEVMYG